MAVKIISENEIFTRLLERLRMLEEGAFILGHFYKAQDNFEKGQGFLAVGEMFRMTQINLINLTTKSLRKQAGLR